MKYTPEKVAECAQWVRENGLIDYGGAKLVDFLKFADIDQGTYYNWMRDYSDFSDAIAKAKADYRKGLADICIQSLNKLAKGGGYKKTKTIYENDEDGKPRIKQKIVEEGETPPNLGANIFLLTNYSDEWQNKRFDNVQASVNAEVKTEYDINAIPQEKLLELADMLQDAKQAEEIAKRG